MKRTTANTNILLITILFCVFLFNDYSYVRMIYTMFYQKFFFEAFTSKSNTIAGGPAFYFYFKNIKK